MSTSSDNFGPSSRPLAPQAMPATTEELEFELEAAIAGKDQVTIYKLIPAIASMPLAQLAIWKVRLAQEFSRDFKVRDFERALKAAQLTGRKRARGPLPEILVTDRPLRDVSRDAIAALRAANDPPVLFVRSGLMVHVVADERGRPKIEPVKDAHLRGRMDRAANFLRASLDGDRQIAPPRDVVEDVLALDPSEWGFPILAAVAEVPTLRCDGTVLDQPGYDAASKLFYAPAAGLVVPEIPDDLTREDVDAAVEFITEAIGEFPFADNASRANAFGLLLTPILRPALGSACTPLALIDAPKAGTGKSLLVDVFSTITTGRPGGMTPYPCTDEEMEKQIGASLMGGRPIICFDNLEGVLRSPALALALTAKDFDKRILGFSENMMVPNNATWLVTGNNIRPSGDMPRRCYHIRLDTRTSTPFRGRTFRHPNLLEWVTANRGSLLHALLVLARAWYLAGQPAHVADPLGSFESWHRTVGSILAHAGIGAFLGNLEEFLAEADEDALQWEAFLWALAERYPDGQVFLASDLAECLRVPDGTLTKNSLRAVLPDGLVDALSKKGEELKR